MTVTIPLSRFNPELKFHLMGGRKACYAAAETWLKDTIGLRGSHFSLPPNGDALAIMPFRFALDEMARISGLTIEAFDQAGDECAFRSPARIVFSGFPTDEEAVLFLLRWR